MSRGHTARKQASVLILAGISLFVVAFFAPDAGHHAGSFFTIARSSSWHSFFDMAAAWCSLKIILISIGLMLVIESLGTILVRLKHRQMAVAVFSTQIISLLVFLTGGFYLLKALL
jgi:hypothetical protein